MEEEAYSECHLTHQPSLLIDMLKFNRSLTKNYMVIKIYEVQICKTKNYHIHQITHASIKSKQSTFISKTFLIYPTLQNKKSNKYICHILPLRK
jgi:hypothetical protein